MGAHVDQTRKPFFLVGNRGTEAAGMGATGTLFRKDWSLIEDRPTRDDNRQSWSVCPHLSSTERLFDYYMASGSIMILLGKCFCYDCFRMVLSKRDLTAFMDSCQHMTDHRFQKDFIHPLFWINREVFKTRRNYAGEEATRWSWVTCSHVSNAGELRGLYSKFNPIFFHEGYVTCNDCTEVVPSASLYLQTLLDCEAMTDDQLQEKVIDQLYPINREVIKAAGHINR
jgi:hypothetical protein